MDHDAVVKEAETLCAHLPRGAAEAPEHARFRSGERRAIKGLEQVHFALALESPGYRDDDIYTAQIFATAFGGGMSSRLFQEAREKRGLCYTIYAQAGAYADTGMTTIYAGTGAEEIAGLAELTVDELKRAAEDMSEAEVARARAQLKAGMLMGLESPSSRAERLARMMAIWGRVPGLEETVARIEEVTPARVRALAGSLAGGECALALYGPAQDAPDLAALRDRLVA